MPIAIPFFLMAVFGALILKAPRKDRQMGCDREFEQSAVLGRQTLLEDSASAERRSEKRYPIGEVCAVSVLGNEESRTTCTLVNVSRSGMRIAVDPAFPTDAQINVEWGGAFFVGTVCNAQVKADKRILGLRVVSTNCR